MLGGDVVAVWEVALSDGVYRIEFAHGTTTGKRIVFVNGKVRSCFFLGEQVGGSQCVLAPDQIFPLGCKPVCAFCHLMVIDLRTTSLI